MDTGTKQRLWEELRDYQEGLIVRRLGAAVENCLQDLGVTPSDEELVQVRSLSIELARSAALSRGIRMSCCDIWDRLYRRLYGALSERDVRDRSSTLLPSGSAGSRAHGSMEALPDSSSAGR